jgi:hypothetical protein
MEQSIVTGGRAQMYITREERLEHSAILPRRAFVCCVLIGTGSFLGIVTALAIAQLSADTVLAKLNSHLVILGTTGASLSGAAIWASSLRAVELLRTARKYAIGAIDEMDHWNTFVTSGNISFGVLLPLIAVAATAAGPSPVSRLESAIHVVTSDRDQIPTLLMDPMLVFRSAKLIDGNVVVDSLLDTEQARPLFKSESVSLSDAQTEIARQLIIDVVSRCGSPRKPLKLAVYGFANDLRINDAHGMPRPDSDLLNMIVANLRGKSLYDAITSARKSGDLSNMSTIVIDGWQPWASFEEMQAFRDDKAFRNFHMAGASEVDQRSAVIVVEQFGKCLASLDRTPSADAH